MYEDIYAASLRLCGHDVDHRTGDMGFAASVHTEWLNLLTIRYTLTDDR